MEDSWEGGVKVMVVCEHVNAGYDPETPVLRDFHSVLVGSYGLIGPSGAGKSTLLKSLLGRVPYLTGTIYVDGILLTRQPREIARLFSYVPQDNGVPGLLTLGEYLTEIARLAGFSSRVAAHRTRWAADAVNLASEWHRRLGGFSGGMKRRALIAAALVRETPWLLLDEPSLGLDPAEQDTLYRLIGQLKHERRIILATQVVDDLEPLDRIGILVDGAIRHEVSWDDLVDAVKGHVYRTRELPPPPRLADILWSPMPGGWIKVISAHPEAHWEPWPATPQDGYLWIVRTIRQEARYDLAY
ncbi:MAG: ABC transporter ATP-binding protein [Sulfobacillus sp.]|nr:ABC transporter ATP-binding protein [Sulfobacillus sp.]